MPKAAASSVCSANTASPAYPASLASTVHPISSVSEPSLTYAVGIVPMIMSLLTSTVIRLVFLQ